MSDFAAQMDALIAKSFAATAARHAILIANLDNVVVAANRTLVKLSEGHVVNRHRAVMGI